MAKHSGKGKGKGVKHHARRVTAAVVHGARRVKRAAKAAAHGARHARRHYARSAKRNPKGFFAVPAVRFAAAAGIGIGIGFALDKAMAHPTWLPESIPLSVPVGIGIAALSYKFGRGAMREYGIAGGVGCAAAGAVVKVSDFAQPLLAGKGLSAITGAPSEARGRRIARISRMGALPQPTMNGGAAQAASQASYANILY